MVLILIVNSENVSSTTEKSLKYSRFLNTVTSLNRAEYLENRDSVNIEHYSLGIDHYTHFTSPIRRYTDIVVHRQLKDILDGKTLHDTKRTIQTNVQEVANLANTKRFADIAMKEGIRQLYVSRLLKTTGGRVVCGNMIKKDMFYIPDINLRIAVHRRWAGKDLFQDIVVLIRYQEGYKIEIHKIAKFKVHLPKSPMRIRK